MISNSLKSRVRDQYIKQRLLLKNQSPSGEQPSLKSILEESAYSSIGRSRGNDGINADRLVENKNKLRGMRELRIRKNRKNRVSEIKKNSVGVMVDKYNSTRSSGVPVGLVISPKIEGRKRRNSVFVNFDLFQNKMKEVCMYSTLLSKENEVMKQRMETINDSKQNKMRIKHKQFRLLKQKIGKRMKRNSMSDVMQLSQVQSSVREEEEEEVGIEELDNKELKSFCIRKLRKNESYKHTLEKEILKMKERGMKIRQKILSGDKVKLNLEIAVGKSRRRHEIVKKKFIVAQEKLLSETKIEGKMDVRKRSAYFLKTGSVVDKLQSPRRENTFCFGKKDAVVIPEKKVNAFLREVRMQRKMKLLRNAKVDISSQFKNFMLEFNSFFTSLSKCLNVLENIGEKKEAPNQSILLPEQAIVGGCGDAQAACSVVRDLGLNSFYKANLFSPAKEGSVEIKGLFGWSGIFLVANFGMNTLTIFKNKKKERLRERFNLQNCKISDSIDNCFVIVIPKVLLSQRKLVIRTKTPDEKGEWIGFIRFMVYVNEA